MPVQNNYEIIGNQLKFYFKGNPSHQWNQVHSPQFRTLDDIGLWCSQNDTVTAKINCLVDGLNQNAMSSTDLTDFLYRWITAYIKAPIDATKEEYVSVINQLPHAVQKVSADITGGVYQAVQQAMQMALDCITFIPDWGLALLTIIFPF